MSVSKDNRDFMAECHQTHAQLLGRQVALLTLAEAAIAGQGALDAVVRSMNVTEVKKYGIASSDIDLVVEIARQGTFTGIGLEPHRFKVKEGNDIYEVVMVQTDDATYVNSGVAEPAVTTLYCKRMGVGLGVGVAE